MCKYKHKKKCILNLAIIRKNETEILREELELVKVEKEVLEEELEKKIVNDNDNKIISNHTKNSINNNNINNNGTLNNGYIKNNI